MAGDGIETVGRAFFSAWGEADAAKRAGMLEAFLSEPFVYADPQSPAPVTSRAAMVDYLAMFTANMLGATAEVLAPVDAHNGVLRATVRFGKDGVVMATGQYFAELGADGTLARIIGFVGKGPE